MSYESEEKWRLIHGAQGYYEISTRGNVRHTANGNLVNQKRQLRNPKSYFNVTLTFDHCSSKRIRIHSKVLETFIGPRPKGHYALHLNGNPHDNRLENLMWGTPKENTAHAREHGTLYGGPPMKKDHERLIIELPPDLKEEFRRSCAEELTDMSTRGRQLIFDHIWSKEMAPKGFYAAGTEQGEPSDSHRKRTPNDARAGAITKRGRTE